jgi:hypothetical protein
MTKRLKKLKDNFKVKIVPSIIVTVCAIVLISGARYIYAAWDTPAKSSGNTLLSADWNALVTYVKTMKTDISTLQTNMTTLSNRITTLENKTGSMGTILAMGQMKMSDGTTGTVHCRTVTYNSWDRTRVVPSGTLFYPAASGWGWSHWNVFFKNVQNTSAVMCIDSGNGWSGDPGQEYAQYIIYGY